MSAGFFSGRKGRARRETLTAYLFLLPSIVVIFVFGLWPVTHALYVSMHKWNIKPKGSECLPYWLASAGYWIARGLGADGLPRARQLCGACWACRTCPRL